MCQKSPNDLECIYQSGKKRRKKSDLLQETSSSVNLPSENRASSSVTTSRSPSGSTSSGTLEIISTRTTRPAIIADVPSHSGWSFYNGTTHSTFPSSGPSTNTLGVSSAYRNAEVTSQTQPEFGPGMVYAATQRAFEHSFGIFNVSAPVYTIDADPQAFMLSGVSAHDRKMLL